MGLVKSPKECLVCLNSIETTFVPTEESQKIFNICCSYVKDAINIEFWMDNFIGNNNSGLSFCKNCLHSSLNLSHLVEQLANIKKEIDFLSASFSKTIAENRIQATTKTSKKYLPKGNAKIYATNNQSAKDSSESEKLILNETSIDNNTNSVIDLESSNSNELTVEQSAIDDLGSEIIKTENDCIFLDHEDESCTDTMSGDNEEKEIKYLMTEEGNEVDPFGEIDLEPTYGKVNNSSVINESEPQIVTSISLAESVSFATKPNLVFKRNPDDVTTNIIDDTFDSTITSSEDKPEVKLNINPLGDENLNRNSNSKIKATNVKFPTHKLRKRYYKCSTCQKCFCSPSTLKRHLVIHTGERPFKCSVCDRAYSRPKYLKKHERIHIRENRYKCPECDISFDLWINMKEHESTHGQDRPYKCSHCVMSFRLQGTLKDHERTHTGERPYQCHFCEVLFKSRQTRMLHQRKVHPDEYNN